MVGQEMTRAGFLPVLRRMWTCSVRTCAVWTRSAWICCVRLCCARPSRVRLCCAGLLCIGLFGLCCIGLLCMGLCWAAPCRAEAQAGASADLTIEFASPAYAAGPQILLGDIARVHVLDDGLRARLVQMEVGAAPIPGGTRKINMGQVQVRMRQQRIDPAAFSFQGPTEVSVTAVAERVAGRSIEQAAIHAVCADAGFALEPDGVKVIRFDYPQGMTVPPGSVVLAASVVSPGADAVFVRANVKVIVSGVAVRTASVWMEIIAPPMVSRGSSVLLVAAGPGVHVTVPATALEDGRPGQRIRVKNTASGIEAVGRVVGPGMVQATLSALGGVL